MAADHREAWRDLGEHIRRQQRQAKDLGEHIRRQRAQAELSIRKLADMAGVSNPYLSQIERGLKRPSARILQQLARALEVSAESLYVQAGILDTEHEPDLVTAIRAQPELRADQKQVLIRILESFLSENGANPKPAEARSASPEPADPEPADPEPADPGNHT